MIQDQSESRDGIVDIVVTAVDTFLDGVAGALPKIFAGLIFLVIAVVGVKAIMFLVRASLKRIFPDESPVYRQFVGTIVAAFLWFGVALSFLSVVGLEQIAAAIDTASGFLALGVSYALSDMIEDSVAGIYLLRDPDFSPGDTVTAGDMTGEVKSIELRKTRIEVDGDTVVRANAEIEKRWTKRGDSEGPT